MGDSTISPPRLEAWIPGLHLLRTYERSSIRSDVVAGVSVAAVAIPIGIAYAQLAGSPPVVGIYSCLAPPVAYALFGSSRQLIVNPNAAACAIVAATATPLAVGDPARYGELSVTLALPGSIQIDAFTLQETCGLFDRRARVLTPRSCRVLDCELPSTTEKLKGEIR